MQGCRRLLQQKRYGGNCLMNTSEEKLKAPPTLFNRKEDCCGCTACVVICPKQAIAMTKESEGFLSKLK